MPYNPPPPAPEGGVKIPWGKIGPYVPIAIGTIGGVLGTKMTNAAAAREAERNRQFQKEMSDTAHQREMKDYALAGLNPMLSAGHGASSPGGSVAPVENVMEGVSKGVASALAIKQAQAQIELTRAQARAADGSSIYSRTQAYDLSTTAENRYALLAGQLEGQQLDNQQKRALMPELLARAKAEVGSVQIANLLDRALVAGALNAEKFEKQIGAMGPWTRLFFEAIRSIGPTAGKIVGKGVTVNPTKVILPGRKP